MKDLCLLFAAGMLLTACSFDYGITTGTDKNKPDIVMENLEYVRVRGGDPLVRFHAEHAERWEDRQTMELKNFTFQQLQNSGADINADGRAGSATVQLASGDISLKEGVKINVKSEDITIWTDELDWKDKEKTLTGADQGEVDIDRSDGTSFTGKGFFADARNRTWNFAGEVNGQYVEKDNTKKNAETTGTSEAQTPVQQSGNEQAQPPPAPEQPLSAPAEEK